MADTRTLLARLAVDVAKVSPAAALAAAAAFHSDPTVAAAADDVERLRELITDSRDDVGTAAVARLAELVAPATLLTWIAQSGARPRLNISCERLSSWQPTAEPIGAIVAAAEHLSWFGWSAGQLTGAISWIETHLDAGWVAADGEFQAVATILAAAAGGDATALPRIFDAAVRADTTGMIATVTLRQLNDAFSDSVARGPACYHAARSAAEHGDALTGDLFAELGGRGLVAAFNLVAAVRDGTVTVDWLEPAELDSAHGPLLGIAALRASQHDVLAQAGRTHVQDLLWLAFADLDDTGIDLLAAEIARRSDDRSVMFRAEPEMLLHFDDRIVVAASAMLPRRIEPIVDARPHLLRTLIDTAVAADARTSPAEHPLGVLMRSFAGSPAGRRLIAEEDRRRLAAGSNALHRTPFTSNVAFEALLAETAARELGCDVAAWEVLAQLVIDGSDLPAADLFAAAARL